MGNLEQKQEKSSIRKPQGIAIRNNMKIYSQSEALDLTLGKIGTPLRDEYEQEMQDFKLGLAIRKAREAQKMTQEGLGK